jgi:serine/threonine-protein kinase
MAGVAGFLKGLFASSGLSRYETTTVVDEGRMSIIYRAREKRSMRNVLLKVYRPDCIRIRNAVRRKQPEIDEVLLSVNHPNVMRIFEFGNAKGQEFTAIEAINGEPLGKLAREGRLNMADAVSVFAKVAEGLAYLHDEKHVVHRDLNPFNIVVTPEMDAKIIDLDFAILEANDTSGMYRRSGTVAYLAPEQVRGHHLDHRVDVYAFGVTMYEALTGVNPYWERDEPDAAMRLERTTYNHLVLRPEPPSKFRPGIPAELDKIILECLEMDADERMQTAAECATRLKELRATLGPAREAKKEEL